MAPSGKQRGACGSTYPTHAMHWVLGAGTWLAPNCSLDLCDCPLHAHILEVMPTAPTAMSCPVPPSPQLQNCPLGLGGSGLCAPLRHGNALPMPAAPQPHTLPYNALFMRRGHVSSEMPLQSSAVPVPAVTRNAGALSAWHSILASSGVSDASEYPQTTGDHSHLV